MAVPNYLSVLQNTPVLSIFPPLFRQNVPSFVHLSPLSTDNFPRSAETTPRFVEYLPD